MTKNLRITLITVVAFMAMQTAYGQAAISIGVKGGLNFANIDTSSPSTAYNSRTGYHAGAFVNFKFTKLAIQPEFIYSVQGSSLSSSGTSQDLSLGYINIPILLKFYLVGGFHLQAGPQFGFLNSADLAGTDIKSSLKSSDTSIALGAGFDISKLTIDARYNMGISEINNAAGISATKNQVIQVSLGYKLFKLGN